MKFEESVGCLLGQVAIRVPKIGMVNAYVILILVLLSACGEKVPLICRLSPPEDGAKYEEYERLYKAEGCEKYEVRSRTKAAPIDHLHESKSGGKNK